MFDFEKEYKKAYDIYKKANNWIQDFYKVIDTDESFSISQSFHDEFNKFAFKFDKQVNEINEEIEKQKISNQGINDEEINKLKSLSINFDSLKKDFNEISEILWHYLIEKDHKRLVENNEKLLGLIKEVESLKNSNNIQIDIVKGVKERYESDFSRVSKLENNFEEQVKKLNKLNKETKDLNNKYKNIVKDFLTILSLFVALFSIVVTNVNMFAGNPSVYLVAVVNLSLLIALSVIFMFIYRLFDFPKEKEKENNNLFKKLIKYLVIILIIILVIHEVIFATRDFINRDKNSSLSNSNQVESSTTKASNFSTGINVVIRY